MFQKGFAVYVDAFRGLSKEIWLLSSVMLINRAGTMVLPFLAIYCRQELDLEPSSIGLLLSAYGVGSVVAGLLGGKVTQRLGSIPTQIISLAMATPGYLLVATATTIPF